MKDEKMDLIDFTFGWMAYLGRVFLALGVFGLLYSSAVISTWTILVMGICVIAWIIEPIYPKIRKR